MDTAYVYAFVARERQAIKFGFTSNHGRRLSEIRAQSPDRIELLGVTQPMERLTASLLEDFLLQVARKHRLRGEWFRLCPQTIGIAILLTQKPPDALLQFFIEKAGATVAETLAPSNEFARTRRQRSR